VFLFNGPFGQDTITDFAINGDKVNLSSVGAITNFVDLSANHLSQVSGNTVITAGANTITLTGVTIAQLDANDFTF